jgi:hypothetical protein
MGIMAIYEARPLVVLELQGQLMSMSLRLMKAGIMMFKIASSWNVKLV